MCGEKGQMLTQLKFIVLLCYSLIPAFPEEQNEGVKITKIEDGEKSTRKKEWLGEKIRRVGNVISDEFYDRNKIGNLEKDLHEIGDSASSDDSDGAPEETPEQDDSLPSKHHKNKLKLAKNKFKNNFQDLKVVIKKI